MPNLCRLGDTNNAGGKIERGAKTVFANGIPVALHVSPISPHGRHRRSQTSEGSPTVFCEGVPVVRVTSGNECGHVMQQGSPNIDVP